MDCLVLPVSILRKRGCGCSRLGYKPLKEEEGLVGEVVDEVEGPVTVVVGKEKREFLVDPFVLEENPFRVLIESVQKKKELSNDHNNTPDTGNNNCMKEKRVVLLVDVDAILFEHMLWLMHNDCSSLFQLNVSEIMDFYDQDF